MRTVSITGNLMQGFTTVSNLFLDYYMPEAKGSYVKIYLYLLRCFQTAKQDFSISEIASLFDESEVNVYRAFFYWEKLGLMKLSKNEKGELTSISLLDPVIPDLANQEESAATGHQIKTGQVPEQMALSEKLPESLPEETQTPSTQTDFQNSPSYSEEQITILSENDEVKWIMNVAERYLERLLRPADIQLILFLYEKVDFSADLILYLYEYCASRGKKHPSYIENVAMSWADAGIHTIEEAEEASIQYSSSYQAVSKFFGLRRMPGIAEQQYIDRWTDTLQLPMALIEEACNRALLSTGRPDFRYADKILESWHSKGVKTMQDVSRLDYTHTQTQAVTATKAAANKPTFNQRKASTNRFNAFPQRSYTGDDYRAMEQKLLNRHST